jgi:peptidyl-prolyl cis-trans isomerase D
LASGSVFGPYVHNGHQNLSRLIGRKSNASAKASHILISWEGTQVPTKKEKRTKEEAKAKADNLLAQVLANPGNFFMLAMSNSDDSSAQQGGDLGYFQPNQMVKPFNDFVFNNAVGKIGLVETDFGFHIINVTDKQDAVLLGTVAKKVQPSDVTIDATYSKASQFEADALENKDFAALAKKSGVEVVNATNIKAFDEYVQGIGAQREIVRWASNKDTDIADVKRFETTQGFVIAKLKSRNETGLLPIDIAKQSVEPLLKNKKKAELIKKKMSGSSLEAVAKASGASVQLASAVAVKSPIIPNVGNEPKIVGKAFNLAAGKTSEVLEGNSGMFMIRTKAVTKAAELPNYATYINQDRTQNQSYSISKAYMALKDKAEIKDNRGNF